VTITQHPEWAKSYATGEVATEVEDYGHKFTKRTQEILAASSRQKLQLSTVVGSGFIDARDKALANTGFGSTATPPLPGIAIADYADLAEHVLEDRE